MEEDILGKNNLLASRNTGYFEAKKVLALNLMSSPGSGKTTLLEKTILSLKEQIPVAVIEGDQQTMNDAERIHRTLVERLQTRVSIEITIGALTYAPGDMDIERQGDGAHSFGSLSRGRGPWAMGRLLAGDR